MRSKQIQKALTKTRALSLVLHATESHGMFASALLKKESELQKMMAAPEVFHSRKHPSVDNSPRPPPKPFPDFEKDRHPPSMQTQPPKPPSGTVIRDAEEQRDHDERGIKQRLGYLEERTTTLENMVEDLTEAVTNPKETSTHQTTTAILISHLVRLSVLDRVLSADAALFAIARELGIVDVTAKLTPPVPPAPPVLAVVPRPPPSEPPSAPDSEPPPRKYRSWTKASETPPGIVGRAPAKKHPGKANGGRAPAVDHWHDREAFNAKQKKHGISQGAIAKEAGLQQTSVSRWQRGAACPADIVKRMTNALDKLIG